MYIYTLVTTNTAALVELAIRQDPQLLYSSRNLRPEPFAPSVRTLNPAP